jgi:Arc/MetJ-type ribon-helix-helix transcriptional regulator
VASVPVMTRLHMEERQLLDTLIDAGVARSRSEALAWAVRLVADNEAEWIEQLRAAMTEVEELRNQGPASQQ